MAKYLFVYHGGSMPESEADQKAAMDAWGQWLGDLGNEVIDGGAPVGMSTTVHSDGSVSDDGGSNPTSGYSLIEAASLEDAVSKAKRCPILQHGGSVELAETFDV
ncbi:hypothetical protein G8764_00315 [Pseudomaricurvus alcaniphilus]|uniref:YciI family protein n=1 Tax=Pseudomaricurvus alcaniphilus TaxID=1166482 RepID=UPI00140B701E|nr:hypothetical protein [Pseudomaricurvus alcaniphilus]NHN35733.1 hypothetical protein [Pseudomaricurvus alcaniphilus]